MDYHFISAIHGDADRCYAILAKIQFTADLRVHSWQCDCRDTADGNYESDRCGDVTGELYGIRCCIFMCNLGPILRIGYKGVMRKNYNILRNTLLSYDKNDMI